MSDHRTKYARAMRRFIYNDNRKGCDPYNSLFGHRHYCRVRK